MRETHTQKAATWRVRCTAQMNHWPEGVSYLCSKEISMCTENKYLEDHERPNAHAKEPQENLEDYARGTQGR